MLMRCISEEDGRKLLKEIHSGIYGNHAASRTLVGKAFNKVSSGRLLLLMQMKSSANARDANILLSRYTCRGRSLKLSRSLGRLQSGVSTWSALYREHRVVLHISLSPSTNSP